MAHGYNTFSVKEKDKEEININITNVPQEDACDRIFEALKDNFGGRYEIIKEYPYIGERTTYMDVDGKVEIEFARCFFKRKCNR